MSDSHVFTTAAMSNTRRVILFGFLSGLIWSVIASAIGDCYRNVAVAITFFISGILTGILVSLSLKSPLRTSERWNVFILGLLSLPFGAFLFGVILSFAQLVAKQAAGGWYPAIEPAFSPFETGLGYALVSVVSLFALVFFPLAILTTFILKSFIHRHQSIA